ncbi:Ig domain-containing protein [Amnibacterium kyonggiense]|uniref:Putative Ig domain-containing protein n=1 Tax=Amnibacterium kyonggiense TaxID=595671 RepID=A0A4R7FS50_9MICO|nr:Ig domain-containing protein [Amnibacterium kyonggiense]TDS80596.1 putative Ig domain-containing protein [Amnibacterium kyonggiense]
MFHRTAQAPCRLSTRRRLTLGGLVMTGALTAGAFVSTPAFADAATQVSSMSDLTDALAAHDPSIRLTQSLDAGGTLTGEDVEVPTQLDLNGFDLTTNGVWVEANASLSVIDSTATPDGGSNSHLTVTAPAFGAVPAVDLASGSTLHVTDVDATFLGAQGGAGISGTADSSFIADGSASVEARGSDDTTHGGGAGIGGAAGQPGIHVTVDGSAQVRAYGGTGAAGVGGGFGAAGGDVHVAGGALQADPGDSIDATDVRASAIGAGENATALGFGGLRIDDGASVSLDSDTPLVLPADAVVHNAGGILMNPGYVDPTGRVVLGSGTIDNTGSITAQDANGDAIDPDQLIDSTVKVTGSNYRITVDPNGGTITGANGTSRHLMSNSLGDLLGYGYSVAAPSGPAYFQGWNTKADGTGTDVADLEQGDLAALGTSTDGTPVSATLYAKFVTDPAPAPEPEGPVLADPIRSTVKIGHTVRLVLGSSTVPATYRIVSGSLPKGVVLDRATGVISGTPSAAGSWYVEVEATNDGGSASTTVLITVPEVKDLLHTRNHVPAVALGAAKVPLHVAGFKKGEHWTVKVDGKVVHRGVMKKAGTLSVTVHLKKALRDRSHTISISGSRKVTDRSTRAATTVTVTSLAARKTFTMKSVAGYDGHKYVVIGRLAAGERVVVKDGAKVIASGHAALDGTFVLPQSKAGKGTSKLTVHGATAKRAGKLTVKNPKR